MKRKNSVIQILQFIWKAIDTVIFSVVISIPVLLLCRIRLQWGTVAFAAGTAAFLLILITRFRKKKTREREALEEKCRRKKERILLMSDEELGKAIGITRFILIRKLHPDICDAFEAIRLGCEAVGILNPTDEIDEVFRKYAPRIRILYGDEIICRAFGSDGFHYDKTSLIRSALGHRKISKYFVFGCAVLCASFFVRYKIYYRMIAGFCLIIASLSGFFQIGNRIRNS